MNYWFNIRSPLNSGANDSSTIPDRLGWHLLYFSLPSPRPSTVSLLPSYPRFVIKASILLGGQSNSTFIQNQLSFISPRLTISSIFIDQSLEYFLSMINYDFSSLLSTFGDCILDFSQPIILILYFEILAGVILFPFLLSFCYPNRSYNRGILCLLPLLTKRSSATGRSNTLGWIGKVAWYWSWMILAVFY